MYKNFWLWGNIFYNCYGGFFVYFEKLYSLFVEYVFVKKKIKN